MEKNKLIALVDAAKNGQSKALGELFVEFHGQVYYIALTITKDPDIACDITQETFIEIIQTIGNLKESAAFVSWMKTIAYHQCSRFYKKKENKHEVTIEGECGGRTLFETIEESNIEFIPDAALDQTEFRKIISDIVKALPEVQRAAVLMYYFDDFSIKEIAEIQGVSEGTVMSRLNYARKAVKKAVEEYEEKNHIRLHGAFFAPLMRWLFDSSYSEPIMQEQSRVIAQSIKDTTGCDMSYDLIDSGIIKNGLYNSIKSLPIAIKIVAVVIAVAIIGGALFIPGDHDGDDSGSNATINASTTTTLAATQTTQLPETDITYDILAYTDQAYTQRYISGTWTSTAVYIDFQVNSSDAERYYKMKSEDSYKQFSDVIVVDTEGSYEYEFKLIFDKEEQIKSLVVNIDKTKPQLLLETKDKYATDSIANSIAGVYDYNSSDGIRDLTSIDQMVAFEAEHEECYYGSSTGQCSRQKVERILKAREWISNKKSYLTVDSSDSLSGIETISYYINDTKYESSQKTFNISELPNGIYIIRVLASDLAGNVVEASVSIKKDDLAPITQVKTDYAMGTYTNSPILFNVSSGAANASPISYSYETTKYSDPYPNERGTVFDGATGGGPLKVTEDPNFECAINADVSFTTYSEAGLTGNTAERRVLYDDTLPYIVISSDSTSQINGYLGDAGTPIMEAYYILDGVRKTIEVSQENNRGYFEISLNSATSQVEIMAVDSAGNSNVYKMDGTQDG